MVGRFLFHSRNETATCPLTETIHRASCAYAQLAALERKYELVDAIRVCSGENNTEYDSEE